MIDAKELRIGNYYYWERDKELMRVAPFDFHELYTEEDDTENWNPVPLTEEWLLKFGFENGKKGSFEVAYNGDDFAYGFMTIRIGRNFILKRKYVHELQNIWFALTGEELTIK